MDRLFYLRILVRFSEGVINIPVSDEYDDVDRGNPFVLLHLILQELEYYEETEDFLVLVKDVGLDAADHVARNLF